MQPIYLDNHATTPLDPRVFRAMKKYFLKDFGNASSPHDFGLKAKAAVERARAQIARLVGAGPEEIFFTSGATESNNLAIKGAARMLREKGDHLITVATEHKSVLDVFKRLSMEGFRVSILPVKKDGLLDLKTVERAITKRTILISAMFANNEIGVVQPLEKIARIAAKHGILLHSDAAQAVGKLPINLKRTKVDLLAFTAHKLYGPKGIGALYVRKREPAIRILPLLDGGGHEMGLRPGTLNVPAIVGFGQACEICRKEMRQEAARLLALRNRLKAELMKALKGCRVNGSLKHRLPHNLNISLDGVESKELLSRLNGIALSAGSACLSSSPNPSHVLGALGLNPARQRASIRFGLGRFNTQDEIRQVVSRIKRVAGV